MIGATIYHSYFKDMETKAQYVDDTEPRFGCLLIESQ